MILRLAVIGVSVVSLSGCASVASDPSSTTVLIADLTSTTTSTSVLEIQEPPPIHVGGTGLNLDPVEEPVEIDCEEAEDLCDIGAYACDDIADYCDIGPDGLGELPDEYDWDGN
jgi:hypothetical protein